MCVRTELAPGASASPRNLGVILFRDPGIASPTTPRPTATSDESFKADLNPQGFIGRAQPITHSRELVCSQTTYTPSFRMPSPLFQLFRKLPSS